MTSVRRPIHSYVGCARGRLVTYYYDVKSLSKIDVFPDGKQTEIQGSDENICDDLTWICVFPSKTGLAVCARDTLSVQGNQHPRQTTELRNKNNDDRYRYLTSRISHLLPGRHSRVEGQRRTPKASTMSSTLTARMLKKSTLHRKINKKSAVPMS